MVLTKEITFHPFRLLSVLDENIALDYHQSYFIVCVFDGWREERKGW